MAVPNETCKKGDSMEAIVKDDRVEKAKGGKKGGKDRGGGIVLN